MRIAEVEKFKKTDEKQKFEENMRIGDEQRKFKDFDEKQKFDEIMRIGKLKAMSLEK